MERYGSALIWTSALGALLIAGVFFAFSSFVMTGLARIPANQGISAMQSINVTVINPLFMFVFLGTGFTCLALIALSVMPNHEPNSFRIIAGATAYILGSIVVTLVFNVPLNVALSKVNADSADGAAFWPHYMASWMFWNHLRAVASLAAGVLLVSALQGSPHNV